MNAKLATDKPYVLLTGATGMVGSRVLVSLLSAQVPVVVIARGKTAKLGRKALSASQRIEGVLGVFEDRYDRIYRRPVVLDGDINSVDLGLTGSQLDWLSRHCTRVIHSAASLSFRPAAEDPANEPFRTNRDGTERLAALAMSLGVSEFHYVSTAYVCGTRSGLVPEEGRVAEHSFSNDYELSKMQAEEHLCGCFKGEALTIYRPSIVIDSCALSSDWRDRTVSSAFSVYHALAAKFGMPKRGEWFKNLGLVGDQSKNLVESQWVADVMVGIFLSPSLHGSVYHLAARLGTSVAKIEEACHRVSGEMLSQAAGRDGAAGRRVELDGEGLEHDTGWARRKMLIDAMAAPYVRTFLPYFRDDPRFGRENIDRALAYLGLPEQPMVGAETLASMFLAGSAVRQTTIEDSFASSVPASAFTTARFDADWVCKGSECWGVIVSGPGGGDFRISFGDHQVCMGGETCDRRLYLASADWQKLLRDEISFGELVTLGRVVIERDSAEVELEGNGTEATDGLVKEANAMIHFLKTEMSKLNASPKGLGTTTTSSATDSFGAEAAK